MFHMHFRSLEKNSISTHAIDTVIFDTRYSMKEFHRTLDFSNLASFPRQTHMRGYGARNLKMTE